MKDYTHQKPIAVNALGKAEIAHIKKQINLTMACLDFPEYREEGAREMAIARSRLEEAAMWATKGLCMKYNTVKQTPDDNYDED